MRKDFNNTLFSKEMPQKSLKNFWHINKDNVTRSFGYILLGRQMLFIYIEIMKNHKLEMFSLVF